MVMNDVKSKYKVNFKLYNDKQFNNVIILVIVIFLDFEIVVVLNNIYDGVINRRYENCNDRRGFYIVI